MGIGWVFALISVGDLWSSPKASVEKKPRRSPTFLPGSSGEVLTRQTIAQLKEGLRVPPSGISDGYQAVRCL